MSLTLGQQKATIKEFQENLDLSGLSKEQVCSDLNISMIKLNKILNLQHSVLEDAWILKNYLIKQVEAAGKTPVIFTALKGDYHHYWFLNSHVIERGVMSKGDN